MKNKTYSLEEVKSEASEFLNLKKDKNETTFLNYRTSFNYFIYYLTDIAEVKTIGKENISKVLEGFQTALFKGFTYKVADNERTVKVKASGVNTHVRRIKTFLNKSLGLTAELENLSVNDAEYKALKVKDVELLINEAKTYFKSEEVGLRNSILIRFLFNTAFRISEALSLRTENLFSEDGFYYVRVHEKGTAKGTLSKPIAISEEDYNSLIDYIEVKSVPSDFVFSTTRTSEDGKAKALSRQYFNKDIKKLAAFVDAKYNRNISKIVENNSSHVFRHSRAVALLNEDKVDIMKVKKFLRHDSINSTQIYLNPEEEAVNELRINNILK